MEIFSGLPELPKPPLCPSSSGTHDLDVYTRPEIRKGCLWDIQLRFNPEFVKKHQLSHIFTEKPRGATENTTYLCLKIRSKLIKPVRELPFTKVATTVNNEGDVLYFNDFSAVTLKVKFTARPRAVFHKHSDMMILLVSVKKGERVIATSETELIFRGGTGSVHSAETRKGATPTTNVVPTTQAPPAPSSNGLTPTLAAFPFTIPPATRAVPPRPQIVNQVATQSVPFGFSPNQPILEFEDFDSQQFCSEFLQNKGDVLLSPSGFGQLDDLLNSENDFSNGIWAENIFSEAASDTFSQSSSDSASSVSNSLSNSVSTTMTEVPAPICSTATMMQNSMSTQVKTLATGQYLPFLIAFLTSFTVNTVTSASAITEPSPFTVVYGKRRGCCSSCADCNLYRGAGGPCNDCGCYPSAHVNIDEPSSRKRKRTSFNGDDEDECDSKRPKYLLEAKYFQKLFFNTLQFLTVPQISVVTARAPVPIFVKVTFFV